MTENQLKKAAQKVEFGDFQTPLDTAIEACKALRDHGIEPKTVIEPTCGKGSFLAASCEVFPALKQCIGYDVNESYIKHAKTSLDSIVLKLKEKPLIQLARQSFFDADWAAIVKDLPQPVLFIGNPPWVTNSDLGQLDSKNLPVKKNDSGLKGLDALTGKSNFDISEWMLSRMLDAIQGTNSAVAMLCKTSVARKVLKYAHDNGLLFGDANLYVIDSKSIFDVSVDACLFRFQADIGMNEYFCAVYESLDSKASTHRFGYVDRKLVANVDAYKKTMKLDGASQIKWRSGLKHDCSAVMELRGVEGKPKNGNGEFVEVESDFLFPLLKSSDLTKYPLPVEKKSVIVTQRSVSEETSQIKTLAPKLWRYLSQNEGAFSARKSSIYKNKPPFSIFGVGPYSFAPWKVAISGMYKQSKFTLIGPHDGKPVMLDDTCYFLSFESEDQARRCHEYLNSEVVQAFIQSIVFWDAKRPISADLLQRISLEQALGELPADDCLPAKRRRRSQAQLEA